jgi:hypothetical protein
VHFAESQLMFQRTMSLRISKGSRQQEVLLRFMLLSYLASFFTIKTKIYFSEMFVDFQWTA